MAFELVVHRGDAELAVGVEPVVAAPVASRRVEEFLELLPHAAWVTKRLAELGAEGATFHLRADATGEWTFTQGPGGPDHLGARARRRVTSRCQAPAMTCCSCCTAGARPTG